MSISRKRKQEIMDVVRNNCEGFDGDGDIIIYKGRLYYVEPFTGVIKYRNALNKHKIPLHVRRRITGLYVIWGCDISNEDGLV